MGQRQKQRFANAISLLEMLLGGIVSWLVNKTLGFLWENLKKVRTRKMRMKNSRELFIRFMASILELHPAKVEYAIDHAKEESGLFKGLPKSLAELLLYSFRNNGKNF
jgi:hypothetical protein